jgi:hypothetical protein
MVTQEPYKLLVGKQISTTTMEILQRDKDRTAIWSSDSPPGHVPKGT